jgi:CheY-like chemotaxis protein
MSSPYLTMPVLNGLEATRLIKATQATRESRVIAYTGNGSTRRRSSGGSSPSCQSHRRRTSCSRLFRTQSVRSDRTPDVLDGPDEQQRNEAR